MNRNLLTALIVIFSLPATAQSYDTTIKGVYIGFSYSPSIFPESWRPAPISAYGENMSPAEIRRTKGVIVKSLNKYPQASLGINLKQIYFLKEMKFYDVPYGGTNSTDALYLVNNGTTLGYTDTYLEQTLHHEFSSILFRNYPALLDTTMWKAANIPGFNYNDPENGVGAIRNNESSQELDTLLAQKGILTQYAGSGIENDVNTFAQNLFRPDERFWTFVDRFSLIRKKTSLLIGFYSKINPVFTEQYFRRM